MIAVTESPPAESIPLLDVGAGHREIHTELDDAWSSVLRDGQFVGGPVVERFEAGFAEYCEAAHCVGVANGTDALEMILAALDIGAGDEVIVPANTFVGTVEAICAVGAHPAFVDVRPDTLLMDADAVAAAVGPRTAAVMAVHLFGQMPDIHALRRLTDRHGLALVEDAAQAHGARFEGTRAGSVGLAAGFSFYPGKNLGALGDGGAVVTRDAALAGNIRRLANHGRSDDDRYSHCVRGRNSRLDALHAAVLSVKLQHLDRANHARRRAMERYARELPPWVRPLAVHPRAESVFHVAVVRVGNRAAVVSHLERHRIGFGIHYPVPCHRQPAYEEFSASLPVVERAADEILSIPLSPTISVEQIDRVCEVLWREPV